ncbi:uncharacterized protein EDB91DRAFT_456056 [Suillus paluster]|uniref:uncharacterized protein n=1 Tax=Suillus paluster TaxID=48578 RepID=UPI001B87B6EE|nr:uncharacterized protein EDB91DRAFT_456056 [Suillus paluster]KAG1738364.1 hypothetical protein EDB91DRAFT_456056 [Suillus paluster]
MLIIIIIIMSLPFIYPLARTLFSSFSNRIPSIMSLIEGQEALSYVTRTNSINPNAPLYLSAGSSFGLNSTCIITTVTCHTLH